MLLTSPLEKRPHHRWQPQLILCLDFLWVLGLILGLDLFWVLYQILGLNLS